MKFIVLIPKVVRNYIAQFPEVRRNAYKYFNYDNRIVDESVERFDSKAPYYNADDFKNGDYTDLVAHAKTLLNPILSKYSNRVAAEDALHTAIRSYRNGLFDGKVNAGRYDVLLEGMGIPRRTASKAPEKPVPEKPKEKVLRAPVLKDLGMERKDIPTETSLSPAKKKLLEQSGLKRIVKDKGKIVKK